MKTFLSKMLHLTQVIPATAIDLETPSATDPGSYYKTSLTKASNNVLKYEH